VSLPGWLPAGFAHPQRADLPTGHHMRPIRESDVDIDYPAVMGSRERLWTIFGAAWGWPPEDMTREEDRVDLARHEAEQVAHKSFNYAILAPGEAALLGCVYIDPPFRVEGDAEVSWWVVDAEVGGPLERCLDEEIPRWIRRAWPFFLPVLIGSSPPCDMTWEEYLALPEAAGA